MIDIDQLRDPIDISIPLNFNGPQPNAYGVEAARSTPVEVGDFVGDTRLGGSVNFEQYSFIPHCNGTHTECVGHITNERISVRDCLKDVFISAMLVSVEAELIDDDRVISQSGVNDALRALTYVRAADTQAPDKEPTALIVRTQPNDERKLTRQYDAANIPPYFTTDGMELIIACGFTHLLVDMPSIDRIFDDGKLANHRMFWNIEPANVETHTATRIHSTITELIYVPNDVPDGEYLLNLQIAPFASDTSPSRPVLFAFRR